MTAIPEAPICPPPFVMTGFEFSGPPNVTANLDLCASESATLIAGAQMLVICLGAGMGVDSGIGTFRGKNAAVFPPLTERHMDFAEASTPNTFARDPHLAMGFWKWRSDKFLEAKPHRGYEMLKKWSQTKEAHFVFTSNIDGHAIEAKFENVVECHGSVRYWQCANNCSDDIWSDTLNVKIDSKSMLAVEPLPKCRNCQASLMRPNVCMFDDEFWNDRRTNKQHDNYEEFLEKNKGKKFVVVEIGAGSAIPSVRLASRRLCRDFGASVIRINLEESRVDGDNGVAFPSGALAAISAIDERLN